MSNEMIRELNTNEIDMVSGAWGFTGGYSKGGSITTSFDGYELQYGFEMNMFEGLGGSIVGGLGTLFGKLFGGS